MKEFKRLQELAGLDEIKTINPSKNNEDPEAYKKIVEFVKNGSKGHLDLTRCKLTSLPSFLKKIDGDLTIRDSPNLISIHSIIYSQSMFERAFLPFNDYKISFLLIKVIRVGLFQL
jgi:hypothetical protein